MTTFQKMIEAAQFEITGGSEYLWRVFGPHARWLDFESGEYDAEFSIIFDSQNQEVYQAALYVPEGQFRWTHPDYIEKFEQENYERNLDPRVAFEGTFFSDCTVLEDFILKVKESFTTGQCDSSMVIPLELTEEQEKLFAQLPEGTNIEEFILSAVQKKVDEMSKQNRENWDIVFSTLSQTGTQVTIDVDNAPISEDNIQEIYNWLNGLKEKEVNLTYTDKQTANGIVSYLTANKEVTPELVFEYNYKK